MRQKKLINRKTLPARLAHQPSLERLEQRILLSGGFATNTFVDPLVANGYVPPFSVNQGQPATFIISVNTNDYVNDGLPSDGEVDVKVFKYVFTDGQNQELLLEDDTLPYVGAPTDTQFTITEPPGQYLVDARYLGDGTTYAASEHDNGQGFVVVGTATTVVTPSASSVSAGQSATFTATVSTSGGTPSAAGFVVFQINGRDYRSVYPVGGSASVAITEPPGSYSITAHYAGDVAYVGSVSAASTLSVAPATSTTRTVVTPSASSVSAGQSATFTATVSSPGGTPSSGSVEFLVNGSNYASVPIAGGSASLAVTEPIGSHSITAYYLGDGSNYAASPASPASTLSVTRDGGADIQPTQLIWTTIGGGVDVNYVIRNQNLPHPTTVALYWATGDQLSDIIGTDGQSFPDALDDPIARSVTPLAAQTDPYTFHVDASLFQSVPDAATNLLAVADPPSSDDPSGTGTILESNESNNILSIPWCRLDVPYYNQGQNWWASQQYANHVGKTIGELGCAMTTLSMALYYAGVTEFPQSSSLGLPVVTSDGISHGYTNDPGNLNQVLRSINGYNGNNDVAWSDGTDAIRNATHVNVQFVPYKDSTQDSVELQDLQRLVCTEQHPVIVAVDWGATSTSDEVKPHHFVLVIGMVGDKFLVNDPGNYQITSLDSYKTFQLVGYVKDPSVLSELNVSVIATEGAVSLAVTDPSGSTTSYDFAPVAPAATVGSDFFFMTDNSDLVRNTIDTTALHGLTILLPAKGNYTVRVTARDSAPYSVTIRGYAPDGSLTTVANWTGQGPSAPPETVAYGVPNLHASPTVQSLQRLVVHTQATHLILTFSESLNAATAEDLSNYHITAPGRDGRFGTHDDRTVAITSAVYDPAQHTVTLTTLQRLSWTNRYEIWVNGSSPAGVTDLAGNLLDGNNDGKPGGVYLAAFRGAVLILRPSPSGFGKGPDAFVRILYDDVLARVPEPAGLFYWSKQLVSKLKAGTVASLFWGSRERHILLSEHSAPPIRLGRALRDASNAWKHAVKIRGPHLTGRANARTLDPVVQVHSRQVAPGGQLGTGGETGG
jgi:hypothetical protein